MEANKWNFANSTDSTNPTFALSHVTCLRYNAQLEIRVEWNQLFHLVSSTGLFGTSLPHLYKWSVATGSVVSIPHCVGFLLPLAVLQLDQGNPISLWDCPPNHTTKNNKDNNQNKIKTTYYWLPKIVAEAWTFWNLVFLESLVSTFFSYSRVLDASMRWFIWCALLVSGFGSSVPWGSILCALQSTFHPFQASATDPGCLCSQADSWAQWWDIAGGYHFWFWRMVGGEPFTAVAFHCFLFAVPGLDDRPPERLAPVSVNQSQVEASETHPAALRGILWHWRQALRLQSCNAAVTHCDAAGLWKAPNYGWPCVVCISFSSEAFRCIREMFLDFCRFPMPEQHLSNHFVGRPLFEVGAPGCCDDGCGFGYCLHYHIPRHHLAGHLRTTAGPSHFRKFRGCGFGQLPSRIGPRICIPSRLFWFLCCLLFTCTRLHCLPCLRAKRSTDILEEVAKLTELCFPVTAEPIDIFFFPEMQDTLQSIAFCLHWFHFRLCQHFQTVVVS